jgi:hypothetical protein
MHSAPASGKTRTNSPIIVERVLKSTSGVLHFCVAFGIAHASVRFKVEYSSSSSGGVHTKHGVTYKKNN